MSLAKEFKEFIARGNVIDLAVGVIIGAAFGKIVNSLVTDIIMPPIAMVTGKVAFSGLFFSLNGKSYPTIEAAKADNNPPLLTYGAFIDTIIQFLIVAVAVFLLVKVVNRLKREQATEPAPPAPPPRSEVLLEEIRDALRNK